MVTNHDWGCTFWAFETLSPLQRSICHFPAVDDSAFRLTIDIPVHHNQRLFVTFNRSRPDSFARSVSFDRQRFIGWKSTTGNHQVGLLIPNHGSTRHIPRGRTFPKFLTCLRVVRSNSISTAEQQLCRATNVCHDGGRITDFQTVYRFISLGQFSLDGPANIPGFHIKRGDGRVLFALVGNDEPVAYRNWRTSKPKRKIGIIGTNFFLPDLIAVKI